MPLVKDLLKKPREAAPPPPENVAEIRRSVMYANKVEIKEVEWLWRPYIPKNMVTIITGDPGMGKGWVVASLASHISQGLALPGQAPLPPAKTLIFGAEDPLDYVLGPRLTKQGAALAKVAHTTLTPNLTTPHGRKVVEDIIREVEPVVVVFDPITSFMGDADPNKQTVVNGLYSELARMAATHRIAIITVRHRRKPADGERKGRDPKFGGVGSIGFQGGARSELLVGMTEDGRRAMAHVKTNLGPEGPTIAFSLDGETGKLTWEGETEDIDGWDLVGRMKKKSAGRPKGGAKAQAAIAFLRSFLRDAPEPAQVCISEAEKQGIGKSTLCAAKGAVVTAFRKEERWWWTLKPQEEQMA